MDIFGSVGQNGTNARADVVVVQTLLNTHIAALRPIPPLATDGQFGPALFNAINAFQRIVLRMRAPDGRVDPGGRTLAALNQPASAVVTFDYPAASQAQLASIATPYIGAREGHGNRIGTDERMREIFESDSLGPGGVTDGYAWCCSFVSMCVQKLIQQSLPHRNVRPPRTASVLNFRTNWAPAQNCLIFPPGDPQNAASRGDIVVYRFSHIGIVTSTNLLGVSTIEGNTNEAGSREGTGVLRKDRENTVIRCFIRLPVTPA